MFKNKQVILLLILDIIFINLSAIIAFWFRFPDFLQSPDFLDYQKIAVLIVLIRLSIFYIYGLYQQMWRYTSISEFISIFYAVTIGSIVISAFVFFIRVLTYPRSVLLMDWLFCLVFISGIRFTPRAMRELRKRKGTPGLSGLWQLSIALLSLANPWHKRRLWHLPAKRILIIGAGDAGEMIVKEIERHPELGYEIVGLIDDDLKKQGIRIHGVEVLGTRSEIPKVVKQEGVEEIIIAIPSASGRVIRDIVAHCEKTRVKFKIVPGVYEIITGSVTINQIREVKPEDLLGRESVQVNLDEISSYLTNKKVLVTGAGGSIGSELCRQVAQFSPAMLILIDHNENSTYFVETELKMKSYPFPILPIIADIKDAPRMEEIFKEYKPEVVFHTAAHKHVPLMEENPQEAIKNNIFGSKIVMELANKYGCERFVLISTDKAVNPISVMGCSKRVAELMIYTFNKNTQTKFMAVRFGNVLGSEGSVIPLFKRQIANGGPLTITHPDVTRYFMTIKEAVELIIQSASLGNGGEIFILDMGEPIKIVDLARDLITLSGFEPEVDIEIKYIGLRPGEKLFEELLTKEEGITSTKHKQIFIARPDIVDTDKLTQQINHLQELLDNENKKILLDELKKIVS
ncbi:MAG: nucleoside-diphosphate sugar epimerase/dehydratase [bacterium]